jgi:hypothetical protein
MERVMAWFRDGGVTRVQSSTWLSAAGLRPAASAPRSHRDPASGGRERHARLASYDAKRQPRSVHRVVTAEQHVM